MYPNRGVLVEQQVGAVIAVADRVAFIDDGATLQRYLGV
jgi:hypothetical protein